MNLSHQTISGQLAQLDVPLTGSEVHGLCCGLLCALPSTGAKTRWFTELLDAAALSPENVGAKAAQIKSLDELFGQTLTSLNDADLEFTPLLPEEDVSVVERARALGDFCAGFTYGIGLSAAHRGNAPLPADVHEIVEDFQAIDAADAIDQVDETGEVLSIEKQETMYTELLEYVRVGVLLVLEELRPITPVRQEKLS